MKIMKKSLCLAMALIIFTAIFPQYTANQVSAEEYVIKGKFLLAMTPPPGDSIPVSNRAQLEAIANNLSGKYHLTADIDLSGGVWTPIGTPYNNNRFAGIFDGQGHVIRNLTVTGNRSYAGLFGEATSDAVIKNVGLENTSIDVSLNSDYNDLNVGGIIGYGGRISNCYNTGSIFAATTAYRSPINAGGISGRNSSINSCYNTGTVSVTASGGYYNPHAGGISGTNEAGFSIENCYNTGIVSANTSSSSSYSNPRAGGISGNNEAGFSIENCYNTGAVSAKGGRDPRVGGIAGFLSASSVPRNTYWNIDSKQTVNDKELSRDEKKGLGQGEGQATALTTEQMKSQSSFSGWDFTNVWTFQSGINSGYPILVPMLKPVPNLDTASDWAREQINEAYMLGLVPSALQNNYRRNITRAEFAALAVKLYETVIGVEITGRSNFNDTNDVNAQKAAAIGVMSPQNRELGLFAPDTVLTREDSAGTLVRLARLINRSLPSGTANFSDNSRIASWAIEYVGQVQAARIMSAGSGNNFNPKHSLTREECIAAMLRLYNR